MWLWADKVGSMILEDFSNLKGSGILWRGKALLEAFLSLPAPAFAAIPGFFPCIAGDIQ